MTAFKVAVSGERDHSFADEGIFALPSKTNDAVSLIVDQAGSLTFAVRADPQFCLCRTDVNGKLDTDFGTDGEVRWQFKDGQSSILGKALLQADGKILLVGNNYLNILRGQPALARLNTSGSPDLVFGRVILQLFPDVNIDIHRTSGCLQRDGKILVICGYRITATKELKILLVRLLQSGEFDPGFGDDGVVELSHADHEFDLRHVDVQPSGRILVVGASSSGQAAVIGVDTIGGVDTGFGDEGFALIGALGADYFFSKLLVLADGRLRCIGKAGSSGALLVGLDEDGKPDQLFNNGVQIITRELLGTWWSICEQDDQKLLVVGNSGGNVVDQVCTRFLSQGDRDTTFGWSGLIYHSGRATDSVLQPSGRWVTTASALTYYSARLNGLLT